MRQILSWAFSILFHVFVALALFQTVQLEPFDLREIMEVDLTQVEPPEPIMEMPTPPAVDPEQALAEPEAPAATAPLPQDKTIVMADEPPVLAPPVEAEPEPVPELDVVEISPVKTGEPERPKDNRIMVRKDDFIVHRGHEARFGRSMMADYYSYSSKEFSGQFRTRDDRVITIIDARNTKYGRFLLYDSKNKTLRRLKQFLGKYVYTIGPSVYEDEPVVGTVTFLAMNDRIERFILTTDDDRLAHYPRKVHVREDEVTFEGEDGEKLYGYTTLPPSGDGHAGIVLIHGSQCVDPDMIKGFTRALSMNDLASLSFMPRGCDREDPVAASGENYGSDVSAALRYMTNRPQMDGGKVGLWGNGQGVPSAIRIAAAADNPARFLVCLIDDTLDINSMPDDETLSRLALPSLWLVTGRNVGKWKPLIARLEGLRDTENRPVTIVLAPLKASQDVLDAQGELSGWVEQVSENHARLATSWVQTIR